MRRNEEHKTAVSITILLLAFFGYVLATTNPAFNILHASPYILGVAVFLFVAFFIAEYFIGATGVVILFFVMIPVGIITNTAVSFLDPSIMGNHSIYSLNSDPTYGLLAGVIVGFVLKMSKPVTVIEGTFTTAGRVIRIKRKK